MNLRCFLVGHKSVLLNEEMICCRCYAQVKYMIPITNKELDNFAEWMNM